MYNWCIISSSHYFINVSGCPAITIPVKLSSNKMPIGIQIMSSNFNDVRLLKFANWLEKKLQFSQVHLKFNV